MVAQRTARPLNRPWGGSILGRGSEAPAMSESTTGLIISVAGAAVVTMTLGSHALGAGAVELLGLVYAVAGLMVAASGSRDQVETTV